MPPREDRLRYGLTVPSARFSQNKTRESVFGENDDSDEDAAGVERQIARQEAQIQSDKKISDAHAAALSEDPNIFDYDAHYDSIKDARERPRRADQAAHRSRYVATLLEKAEERKIEQEIMMERQRQREQEAEDRLYGASERFVTATYKKKMEELSELREKQRATESKEEAESARRKGHMGDFYKNILQNNVAFGTAPGPRCDSNCGGVEQNAGGTPDRNVASLHHRLGGTRDAPRPDGAASSRGRPFFPLHEEAGSQGARQAGIDITKHRQRPIFAAEDAPKRRRGAENSNDTRQARSEDESAHGDKPAQTETSREESQNAAEPTTRPAVPFGSSRPTSTGELPGIQKDDGTQVVVPGSRRNDYDSIAAARARFLARKRKSGPPA